MALGEAVLDGDIVPQAVTEIPQTVFKRFNEMERALPRADRLVADPIAARRRLLRTRGKRLYAAVRDCAVRSFVNFREKWKSKPIWTR